MSPTTDPVAELRSAVAAAAAELSGNGATKTFSFDRPPKPEFGDYSTNAAMLLAPTMGEPPRTVAERLGGLVEQKLADEIEKVDVAGPGFLNLFMSDAWWRDSLKAALDAADGFGGGTATAAGIAEKILVEFVSANPTGPITVASARHAAYGDSLSRILEFAGHDIEREYYVNDAGGQVQRFAQSIQARARGEEPPEDGYHGGYVEELARKIDGAADMDLADLARRGIDLMIEDVRAALERFGVHMDTFFFERTVHDRGEIEHALEILDEHGHIYGHEDAVWLRTTSFGDDKDRVLRRSSGEYTYFAPDIAYHVDKRERGFDRLIDVWGADHHGYQKRMLAAWEALGGEPGKLELIIMQLVNLVERGQRVQMSKRRGEFITLDDLIDDIGVDAARYFLLQRSHDTTLDLDLTLAREQSDVNPVYYVQYAHARIASILRKAGEGRVLEALGAEFSEELHPSERALLKRLLAFPDEVAVAAARRAPHRLTTYAHEVAQDFSAFYRDCRVVGAAEEGGDEDFRIAISVMTQRVIATSLGLLGVSAPEQM
jgi:arginyl-tRNA synthetase